MKALAFIDLLGFSQMVSANHKMAKLILNDFYDISYQIIKNEDKVHGHLFSDSLMAHSSDPAILVNIITEIYRECLRKNNNYTFPLGKFFLLPRGGISFGLVEIQARSEKPNLTKDFIISPALVHSAKIESQIKGSRLLIADIDNNERSFKWDNNIKSVLHANSTFTFWEKYKYFDALWFLDLSKQSKEQKEEVMSLIQISEKLVSANSQNKKIIEHHLQTLRIGLLSLSRFLTSDDNFLLEFLANYRDDSYWLIWLTLIEMIMNSPDNREIVTKTEVRDFYRVVSLMPGWSNVIKEINKPKNEYLLRLFHDFIAEMV